MLQYHCVDDKKAKSALGKSGLPSKDRVWLQYTILKDADALDRVRFGMRSVDPKFFRNEVAHKLLPTAQVAVSNLKFAK